MKNLIICAALLMSASTAYPWEMPGFPSLEEQYQSAKLDELTAVVQAEPYFAGKIVEIEVFGKRVAVDRRGEPNPHPGSPPPASGIGQLTEFLNGLDAAAKGDLQIGVSRQWYETGVLKEEKWNIVIHGSYNVKKEATAPDKEDKKTGEGQ